MQNLGSYGLMGAGVKIRRKSAILRIINPDLLIHYATFMGL